MEERACGEAGFRSRVQRLPAETSCRITPSAGSRRAERGRGQCTGSSSSYRFPDISTRPGVMRAVDPAKDVDGFHPINVGRVTLGELDEGFVPATPAGSCTSSPSPASSSAGAEAVVLGRRRCRQATALSPAPTARDGHDLPQRDARSASHTSAPRLLRGGGGEARIVTADIVSPVPRSSTSGRTGSRIRRGVVADELVGDVDFAGASRVAGWITPVPGGVGPIVRITMLLETPQGRAAGGRIEGAVRPAART